MSRDHDSELAARRSRPRDRKAQILTAASDLFYRFGYHSVSTEQIASAVGITAGGLYRHFRSKEDLLAATVIDRFDLATREATDSDPQDLNIFVARIVASAVGRRELGVLWSRETRHLGSANRAIVHSRFHDFLGYFAAEIRRLRPELTDRGSKLIAWSTLAVLTSPSYHRTVMSVERLTSLLQALALTVCCYDPGSDASPGPARQDGSAVTGESTNRLVSRREMLLSAASRLFNNRGYTTVTMDEIGAAAGVTSTSVYRYFATKSDLLSAVIVRANEPLRLGIAEAIAASVSPTEALRGTIDAYVSFALVQHDLLGVLVTEVMNLPAGVQHGVKGAQNSYVAEWLRLVALVNPRMDAAEVRFRVHAALTVINDITRTTELRERTGVAGQISEIAMRLVQSQGEPVSTSGQPRISGH